MGRVKIIRSCTVGKGGGGGGGVTNVCDQIDSTVVKKNGT